MFTRAFLLLSFILCVSAFSASLPAPLRNSARVRSATLKMMEKPSMDRREAVLSSIIFGAATLLGGEKVLAVENAPCTFANCPAPTGTLELELYNVKTSKFTGKGYSFQKPTSDTFKQVISPSSLANPGGFLFRDKLDPDTAIYADVQKVKGANQSWKPALVDSYTKQFKDRFKLLRQEGPVKVGNADMYFFEYQVETTISGAQELMHFYSTFAAGENDVYVLNAQTKEKNNALMGATLEKVAKSLAINE